MAGGNWTAQNKIRPGVYINFASDTDSSLQVGMRGTVAICEPLSWGAVGEIKEVAAGADTTPFVGYPIYQPQARFLNEIFKGSDRTNGPTKVLLYRPQASGQTKAAVTVGTLTATAKYPGVRGNGITMVVTESADDEGVFTVDTVVDGAVADSQTAAAAEDLTGNDWVDFSGTGALSETAGAPLTGGADGTVETAAYSTFLTALEPYDFDILIYDGTDGTVQAAFANFVQRLAENEGRYSQLVASGVTAPDDRFVINVNSPSVRLADGTVLTPQQVCWWVGGAEAGAQYNEGLTYASYPDVVDVFPRMTSAQIEDAITAGQLVLTPFRGAVHVETDINSLTTYTEKISKVYHKNRVIRLCNTIANDLLRQFSASYLGVVNNNAEGRDRFKSQIVGYLLTIQNGQGIQNFSAEDVEVLAGEEIDSIVVNLAIQAVDAVEKIYMTITVR